MKLKTKGYRISENRRTTPLFSTRRKNTRSNDFQGHPRKNKPKSMDFEEYASEGNRFVNAVAEELATDRNTAARLTRAVLHAIRDRLPADDAIQFAQGLPMALKGIFLDGYDVSKTPVVIRTRDKFIDFVRGQDGLLAKTDLPTRQSVEEAVQAVFIVLEQTVSFGQIQHIKRMLNTEILELIEGF